MARRLNIPVRTWYNYEGGVTVPAEVMLKIIELTSVEPIWLLHGKGPKFRLARSDRAEGESRPSRTVGALLRTALQMLENGDSGRARTEPFGVHAGSAPESEFEFTLTPDFAPEGDAVHRRERQGAEVDSRPSTTSRDWVEAQRDNRCVQVSGDSMAPIVADGAAVAYSDHDEDFLELDGKIVVVWIAGQPIVRWFQNCGRYALLRAENPTTDPQQMLIDLENTSEIPRFRRVLWINTPH
jgi:phage repressor protein C with HTH and peptisase S24 domain